MKLMDYVNSYQKVYTSIINFKELVDAKSRNNNISHICSNMK